MTKTQIHKILMEMLYTPDAKPRFVGGDIETKLQLVDDTAKMIMELHHEDDEVKNAAHYLCNDDVELEDQIQLIKEEMEGDTMIDYVEGVTVWEKVTMQFTCDEFIELIS